MKVRFEETQKYKNAAVGDIMQYRLGDDSLINGMIIMVAVGEYRMFNLETCLCGTIKAYSANKLADAYSDQIDFVIYRKSEWDIELNIKPKHEVGE